MGTTALGRFNARVIDWLRTIHRFLLRLNRHTGRNIVPIGRVAISANEPTVFIVMLGASEPPNLCTLALKLVPSDVKRRNKLGSVMKGPFVGVPFVEAYGFCDSFDTFRRVRIFFVLGRFYCKLGHFKFDRTKRTILKPISTPEPPNHVADSNNSPLSDVDSPCTQAGGSMRKRVRIPCLLVSKTIRTSFRLCTNQACHN